MANTNTINTTTSAKTLNITTNIRHCITTLHNEVRAIINVVNVIVVIVLNLIVSLVVGVVFSSGISWVMGVVMVMVEY